MRYTSYAGKSLCPLPAPAGRIEPLSSGIPRRSHAAPDTTTRKCGIERGVHSIMQRPGQRAGALFLFSRVLPMATSSTVSLSITGMSCGHCVTAVTRALSGVGGLIDPSVAIGSARFSIAPGADPQEVQAAASRAIEQEGYQVNGEAPLTSLRKAPPDDSRTA